MKVVMIGSGEAAGAALLEAKKLLPARMLTWRAGCTSAYVCVWGWSLMAIARIDQKKSQEQFEMKRMDLGRQHSAEPSGVHMETPAFPAVPKMRPPLCMWT